MRYINICLISEKAERSQVVESQKTPIGSSKSSK